MDESTGAASKRAGDPDKAARQAMQRSICQLEDLRKQIEGPTRRPRLAPTQDTHRPAHCSRARPITTILPPHRPGRSSFPLDRVFFVFFLIFPWTASSSSSSSFSLGPPAERADAVGGALAANGGKSNMDMVKERHARLLVNAYAETGELKIPAVVDYVRNLKEGGTKFLVFAHHMAVMDAIGNALEVPCLPLMPASPLPASPLPASPLPASHACITPACISCPPIIITITIILQPAEYIRIDGGTPAARRSEFVQRFQSSDEVRVAILSLTAASTGFSLTASSTVVFAELCWTPGILVQAEDRVHRIGQMFPVNVQYLLAPKTVDEMIWKMIAKKLEVLSTTLNGEIQVLEATVSTHDDKQRKLLEFFKPVLGVDDPNMNASQLSQVAASPASGAPPPATATATGPTEGPVLSSQPKQGRIESYFSPRPRERTPFVEAAVSESPRKRPAPATEEKTSRPRVEIPSAGAEETNGDAYYLDDDIEDDEEAGGAA
ncbi:putative Chromatin remodeling factor18 [Paratrimastix pyriformis]|uniref:Chromatin remodeling factor18 n=1 Tax=Paratrimastix pyriformis TaxID=342808 RepID=A0ABQ8UEW9_9EUKA|nr:putative Chromatin remodeling factor18 [Paratrimastix pyriformis]